MAEVSGFVDAYRIWYRFPEEYLGKQLGNTFLCVAIIAAMKNGEPIEVDDTYSISPKLMRGLKRIQEIFHAWYPWLNKVSITARCEECDDDSPNRVGSFFSGGVDGMYTLFTNSDDITDLVFVRGVDMWFENISLFEEVIEKNREFAKHVGKRLVIIETNAREWAYSHKLSWANHFMGGGLSSLTHVLNLKRSYIAASQTYTNPYPDGSHPVTDPMWSTERSEIIYDSGIHRTEKVKRIAKEPQALDILRVCFQNQTYNCGECEKCLRTMMALHLIGCPSPTLPPMDQDALKRFSKLRLHDASDHDFSGELLNLAIETDNKNIQQLIAKMKRREKWIRHIVNADKKYFFGLAKKMWCRG